MKTCFQLFKNTLSIRLHVHDYRRSMQTIEAQKKQLLLLNAVQKFLRRLAVGVELSEMWKRLNERVRYMDLCGIVGLLTVDIEPLVNEPPG